jgi:RimJ/RimL family protein N-acetyltransferase
MHTVRPATMADAARLFEWRNDPLTRKMSLNTDTVEWSDHLTWLQRALSDDKRQIAIHCVGGEPCGTTRLDWDDGVPEVSIAVSPKYRGSGLAATMLAAILPKCEVKASIKRTNTASRALFTKLGFMLEKDGDVQLYARPSQTNVAS